MQYEDYGNNGNDYSYWDEPFDDFEDEELNKLKRQKKQLEEEMLWAKDLSKSRGVTPFFQEVGNDLYNQAKEAWGSNDTKIRDRKKHLQRQAIENVHEMRGPMRGPWSREEYGKSAPPWDSAGETPSLRPRRNEAYMDLPSPLGAARHEAQRLKTASLKRRQKELQGELQWSTDLLSGLDRDNPVHDAMKDIHREFEKLLAKHDLKMDDHYFDLARELRKEASEMPVFPLPPRSDDLWQDLFIGRRQLGDASRNLDADRENRRGYPVPSDRDRSPDGLWEPGTPQNTLPTDPDFDDMKRLTQEARLVRESYARNRAIRDHLAREKGEMRRQVKLMARGADPHEVVAGGSKLQPTAAGHAMVEDDEEHKRKPMKRKPAQRRPSRPATRKPRPRGPDAWFSDSYDDEGKARTRSSVRQDIRIRNTDEGQGTGHAEIDLKKRAQPETSERPARTLSEKEVGSLRRWFEKSRKHGWKHVQENAPKWVMEKLWDFAKEQMLRHNRKGNSKPAGPSQKAPPGHHWETIHHPVLGQILVLAKDRPPSKIGNVNIQFRKEMDWENLPQDVVEGLRKWYRWINGQTEPTGTRP